MATLDVTAILLTLTALCMYVNSRFLKLPPTVGLMALSATGAGILALLQFLGFGFVGTFSLAVVEAIDLNAVVLNGFLCLLLFVGALHVDIGALREESIPIALLATGGVLVSTLVVGIILFLIVGALGLPVSFWFCLAFGALIAPTDAVTVLSFLRNTVLPSSVESKITGESLLNDGMSIVLFLTILGFAVGTGSSNVLALPFTLAWSILGSIGIGLGLGLFAHHVLVFERSHNPYVPVLITLALATGSYAVANTLSASGPIAVVVAGLLIGNRGHVLAESAETNQRLTDFWDLTDELLNAVLFVIIGLELLAVSTNYWHLLVGLLCIPVVLFGRYVSVALMTSTLVRWRTFAPNINTILTWGGLRGGISIALVLSLPTGVVREVLMTATYCVVLFSVFVQGPTLPRLVAPQQEAAP